MPASGSLLFLKRTAQTTALAFSAAPHELNLPSAAALSEETWAHLWFLKGIAFKMLKCLATSVFLEDPNFLM